MPADGGEPLKRAIDPQQSKVRLCLTGAKHEQTNAICAVLLRIWGSGIRLLGGCASDSVVGVWIRASTSDPTVIGKFFVTGTRSTDAVIPLVLREVLAGGTTSHHRPHQQYVTCNIGGCHHSPRLRPFYSFFLCFPRLAVVPNAKDTRDHTRRPKHKGSGHSSGRPPSLPKEQPLTPPCTALSRSS